MRAISVTSSSDLKQRLRVNVCQPTKISDVFRHLIQRKRLRHGRTRLPQALGDLVVGQSASFAELRQRFGFLERGQVLALEVLDEGDLGDFVVRSEATT